MGIERAGRFERALRGIFVPLFLLSGVAVAAGFFFPRYIGEVVPGSWWLTIALVFFGTGLGYLAVLPTASDEPSEETGAAYLLHIRREGVTNNIYRLAEGHDRVTFGVPLLALVCFFIVQRIAESQLLEVLGRIEQFLTVQLGWLFILAMTGSVVVCAFLVLSKWGDIRLGGSEASPSYTYPVYFTMFFTAGIAAGIVFWGPAEPVMHYGSPAPMYDVQPGTVGSQGAALTYALFHWGFTAWSAYLVLGLPIAYFVYEYGAPLRVSAILTPFLGAENLSSPLGKLVDVLAIFATIGGIATSVALVSHQFLAGIDYQWAVQMDRLGPILFVGGLTIIFVLSAQSGVHRGIRRIAGVNILLFIGFGALLLALGPTRSILALGSDASAQYVIQFVPLSLEFGSEWVATWTIWNWAWWFSWAPFAGLFLAALSRGRTIRTVVLTGVGATGLASMAWFIILGGSALTLQHDGSADILESIDAHPGGEAVAGFPLMDALALSDLLMFLFLALIIVFMATSADTSTLVVSILASTEDQAPSTATIVFWGIFQGIVAIVVVLTGTGQLLQQAAVLTGGPFAIIAIIAIAGMFLGFRQHDDPGDGFLRKLLDRIRTRMKRDSEVQE